MLRVTTTTTGPAGAPYYTTMYFEGAVLADAQAASNAVKQFWTDCSSAIGATTNMLVNSEVEVVDPASGQVTGTFNVPQLVVGGVAGGDHLPDFTQGLVRWLTGIYVNGRQLRGRTFIPSPTEAAHTGGNPTAGYVSDVQAAADTLMGTSDLGVYSPTHRVFALGTTASVWQRWALLRSRRD